jgi:hypothetical protein
VTDSVPGTEDVVRSVASALAAFDSNLEVLQSPGTWLTSASVGAADGTAAESAAPADDAAALPDAGLGPPPGDYGEDFGGCSMGMGLSLGPALESHVRELARARAVLATQAAEVLAAAAEVSGQAAEALQATMVASGLSVGSVEEAPAAAVEGADASAAASAAAPAVDAGADEGEAAASETDATLHFLSAGASGTLQAWRSDAPRPKALAQAPEEVHALLLLPDDLAVTASRDGLMQLWRFSDGACLRIMRGHAAAVRGVTSVRSPGDAVPGCAAANLVLVSASDDKTLRLWPLSDAVAGAHATLGGEGDAHAGGVTCVAALAGGCVASGSRDTTVRIWALTAPLAGVCTRVLAGHAGAVHAVCDLSDGRLASASTDGTARIWTAATGACLRVLDHGGECVTVLAALPSAAGGGKDADAHADGDAGDDKLVTGAADGIVRVWDTFSGALDATLKSHGARLCALAALRRGGATKLVSSSMDGEQCVWSWAGDGAVPGTRERLLTSVHTGGPAFTFAPLD